MNASYRAQTAGNIMTVLRSTAGHSRWAGQKYCGRSIPVHLWASSGKLAEQTPTRRSNESWKCRSATGPSCRTKEVRPHCRRSTKINPSTKESAHPLLGVCNDGRFKSTGHHVVSWTTAISAGAIDSWTMSCQPCELCEQILSSYVWKAPDLMQSWPIFLILIISYLFGSHG